MGMFRYRAFWSLILVVLAYILFVKITPIRPRGDGLRAVFLILSGWGMFAYWRPFKRAMATEGWPDGPLRYAVMIFMFCAAINLNAGVGLFWRLAGQPAFLINNAVFDFWIVLGSISLLIAVTVPNLFGKGVPPLDRLQLGSIWLTMFILVCYLSLVRPDLEPLANLVRGYIDSGYEYDPPG